MKEKGGRESSDDATCTGLTHTSSNNRDRHGSTDDTTQETASCGVEQAIGSYWASFAAKGDPNGPGLPAWPAFKNMTSGRVMVFGDSVQVEAAAPTKVSFFDSAYARQIKN